MKEAWLRLDGQVLAAQPDWLDALALRPVELNQPNAPAGLTVGNAALAGPPWTGCYRARFVRAGQVRRSDNTPAGLSIQPSALEQAVNAGQFENRAVFIDHSAQHPSLGKLAGVTSAARWNAQDRSVEGIIRLYNTHAGRQAAALVDSLLADPQRAPDVGLSLVFYPLWDGETITGVRHVESVDLVFQPAADGRILARQAAPTLEPISNPIGEPDMIQEPAKDVTTESNSTVPGLPQFAVSAMLASSGLPAVSAERLRGGEYANVEALEAAIEGERVYLAALQQDEVIKIGGAAPRGGQVTGMRTGLDRVELALDGLLTGKRPAGGAAPLTGIRELYHLLSGDYEMSGVFQGERVQFANVNCSTMANMVANALNKVIVNEFQQYPRWWDAITTQQDFGSMQTVKWMSLGGVGELPTVAEGAAYTELSWTDGSESSAFLKKGGYLGITLEAIDKDDTGRLMAAPRALAQAAWLTLSKAVSNVFTANAGVGPNLADGNPLFSVAHGNVNAFSLDPTAYAFMRAEMRKFTELGSGERLGALTAPKYLLVPPDLEITALEVLGSERRFDYDGAGALTTPDNALAEGENFGARMAAARNRVIVVDLWTDKNNWAGVADPRLWPTIGIGYRNGRQPEVFSVASPTAGLMFTNDTLPVKVRFVFAVGPMDWRGLFKMNVVGG